MKLRAVTARDDNYDLRRVPLKQICPGMIFLNEDQGRAADGMVISVRVTDCQCVSIRWLDIETNRIYDAEIADTHESLIADWVIVPV